MSRIKIFVSVLVCFLTLSIQSCMAQEKPNIIIIYIDDQGYGDVSALNPNAKFKTPNIVDLQQNNGQKVARY